MFFELDEMFLQAIKNLSGDTNWMIIKDRINSISDIQTANALHSVPSETDVNYDVRSRINQGISIAMDALKHVVNDPDDFLKDIQEMNRLNELLAKNEGQGAS